MAKQFKHANLGHQNLTFSYLDIYEEQIDQQRKAYEAFQKSQTIEEGENESKKPAFFQRDKKLEAAKKELESQRGDQ